MLDLYTTVVCSVWTSRPRQNTIGNEGPKLVAADVSAHHLVLPIENKTMVKGEHGLEGEQG